MTAYITWNDFVCVCMVLYPTAKTYKLGFFFLFKDTISATTQHASRPIEERYGVQ